MIFAVFNVQCSC